MSEENSEQSTEEEEEEARADIMAKRVDEVLNYNSNYFDTQDVPPDVVLSAALSMAATAATVLGLDQTTFLKLSRRVLDKSKNHPAMKGIVEEAMQGQVKH